MKQKKIFGLFLALIAVVTLSSCNKTNLEGRYTYRQYLAGSPSTWNVHTWDTSDDSYIIDYTEMGLYDLILNESKDGYEFVTEMASAFPVDVSGSYAGLYGLPSNTVDGDKLAFKISLNPNAVFANGDVINADTYVTSMKYLLDPAMQNRRADSYYTGELSLANAEKYFKQGQTISESLISFTTGAEASGVSEQNLYLLVDKKTYFFGDTIKNIYEEYTEEFIVDGVNLMTSYISTGGKIRLTTEMKNYLKGVAANFGDNNPDAWKEFLFYDTAYGAQSFEEVGIKKTGEYEITLILSKPINDFYIKYYLSGNWIVHIPTYEKTLKTVAGLKTTKYGTSVGNYMSYGPYKLTEYQLDKQIKMVKNAKWYGYSDNKHEGQFQTTHISCAIIKDQNTALMSFLKGDLDEIAMTSDNMETYGFSSQLLRTPQTYTTRIVLNNDYDKLKSREKTNVNKTLLSYVDFRKAVSLAIDRADFAASCTAAHQAGFGLINYLYLYDPENGLSYRDTTEAEQTLLEVYDASTIEALTGYNPELAAQLMTSAYNAAFAAGDIKATDKVVLEFLVYNDTDATTIKMYNFILAALRKAAEGTPLEGKIEIQMTKDEGYYDSAAAGNFEMILGTWGGGAMNPFGLMQVYVDTSIRDEYGFDPEKEMLTITIGDAEYTKSYLEWYTALNDGEYAASDFEDKLIILAAMEKGILQMYNAIPLYYRYTARLYSYKINYGTTTYIENVTYGGIRFLTYNKDDAGWKAVVKSYNGRLPYTA